MLKHMVMFKKKPDTSEEKTKVGLYLPQTV